MTSAAGRIWRTSRAWLKAHHGAVETMPGVLGSLLLHGLALALILFLILRQTVEPPERPFHVVPVDLVALGENTTAPPAPTHAPAPQQQAARGPLAAPRPEGASPTGKRPLADPLAVRLKQLAKLRRPDSTLAIAPDGTADMTATSDDAGIGPAVYSVRDYIRAQVLRRWNLDLTRLGGRNMRIALHVTLTAKGTLADVRIVDQQRYKKDAIFRDIALSARNAVILSAPFKIPPGVARPALDFTMTLEPRDTLR